MRGANQAFVTTKSALALCNALPLSEPEGDGAREWLHLLPGGGEIHTGDGRGPYTVDDYEALAAAIAGASSVQRAALRKLAGLDNSLNAVVSFQRSLRACAVRKVLLLQDQVRLTGRVGPV